jgi:hypothetical protein
LRSPLLRHADLGVKVELDPAVGIMHPLLHGFHILPELLVFLEYYIQRLAMT